MLSIPEKKVNENRCYLCEIHRWRTAQYFTSRYDHLFFAFDDIEKYNEISGSMTLTVAAIIEFANETRDDTRAIDSAELSLKKASYSGPSMPGKNTRFRRLRQTKPLWNGEHNRYVCRTGKRNGWKKLDAD